MRLPQCNFKILVRIVAIFFILCTAFLVIWFATHRKQFTDTIKWIQHLGVYGNLVLGLGIVAVCFPIAVGYIVFALISGYLYGYLYGALTTYVSVMIGSCLCFFMSGGIAKEWLMKRIEKLEKTKLTIKIIQSNAFKITFLLRFTPIPLGVQNAIFGTCGIKFKVFLPTTALGLFPELMMWTYFGHSAKTIEDIISGKSTGGTLQKVLLGMEVASVVVLAAVIIYLVKRVLKKHLDEKEKEENAMLINSSTENDIQTTETPREDIVV